MGKIIVMMMVMGGGSVMMEIDRWKGEGGRKGKEGVKRVMVVIERVQREKK